MYSVHPISNMDMATSRTTDILREAAQARLVKSVTETAAANAESAPKATLRRHLGNLLVRSGERLQAASRSTPVEESGVTAGILHLAR